MKNKRIICFLLSVVLVLGLCTGCGKKDKKDDDPVLSGKDYTQKEYKLSDVKVTKDETVYVNLNADGSISKINVSDHLHAAEPQVRIQDASDLDDISDVKTFIEPVIKDGKLFWDMESTDLYYNGITKKEPPISIEVNYYLNGKIISPKRLEGKSGKVDIEIKVTNNLKKAVNVSGAGYDVYCPMIMAGGMIVPDEGFSNVSVENGTILGDGSHQIVMMLGVPGMDESIGASSLGIPFVSNELCNTNYKISADVTDFALGNLMFAAVPFSSIAALSNEDMSDDVSGINQVLADLQSIMNAMSSQSVDNVIDMLYGDVTQTEKLIKTLSNAADVYEKNKPLIDLLINTMSDDNLNAISQLASDLENLDLAKTEESATNSLIELSAVLAALNGDMGDLSKVAGDLKRVLPVLNTLESALNTDEMQEIRAGLPESLEQIRKLRTTLQESENLLNNLSAITNSDFANQMKVIIDTTTKYTKAGNMSQAEVQNLAGRMKEWLSFGQTYNIFSDKADGVDSTVMFIYKTAAIG